MKELLHAPETSRAKGRDLDVVGNFFHIGIFFRDWRNRRLCRERRENCQEKIANGKLNRFHTSIDTVLGNPKVSPVQIFHNEDRDVIGLLFLA
jgi:hypothetical protein